MSDDSASEVEYDSQLEEEIEEIDQEETSQQQINHLQHILQLYAPNRKQKCKSSAKMDADDTEPSPLPITKDIKQEFIKEETESVWNPVVYKEDPQNNRRIKFQYKQNSLYPTKIIKRKKKTLNRDLSDPAQVKAHLQQLAKEYHKNLLDEVMQQQRIKKEAGIKDEDDVIHLDHSLNRFPIYNLAMREMRYSSIEELKTFLSNQQTQILGQINDPNLSSVFVASLEQIVKPSNTSKEYINLKCKVAGCEAILKCVVTIQECELYTFRNKHNHTISGQLLPQQKKHSPEIITIDEELHKMFDINKGVRSETRNIRYIDPQERKIEKKKDALRRRMQRVEGAEQPHEDRPIRVVKKKKSKSKVKVKDVKKTDAQFSNLTEELELEGYKVYAFHKENTDSLFPEALWLTKQQMISAFTSASAFRLSFAEQAIKLDKKKYSQCSSWSIAFLTAHNAAIKTTVLAVFLSQIPLTSNLNRLFTVIPKILPQIKYLITEYRPQIRSYLNQIQCKIAFKILFDSEDLFTLLKKDLKDQKNSRIIKEMIGPSSIPIQKFITYFNQCKQIAFIQKYNELKKFMIQPNALQSFLEFDHNLKLERQLITKIKAKLRGGLNRYTLKAQLCTLMQACGSINKQAGREIELKVISNMQIQKAHQDYGLFLVRQSVAPTVLNHFYQQYCRTCSMKLKEESGRVLEDGCELTGWSCSCGFLKLTGIPCKHLIFVLKQQRKNYLGLFNRKWIINDQHLPEQQIANNEEQIWKMIKRIELAGDSQRDEERRSRSRDRVKKKNRRIEDALEKDEKREKRSKKKIKEQPKIAQNQAQK